MTEAIAFYFGLTLLGAMASLLWFAVHRTLLFHLAAGMVLPAYMFQGLKGATWPQDLPSYLVAGACILSTAGATVLVNFLFFASSTGRGRGRFQIRATATGGSLTSAMVISLGINTMALAAIALAWSSQPVAFAESPNAGWTALVLAMSLYSGIGLFLKTTPPGLQLRAVAVSPGVAATFGLDPRPLQALAIFVGSSAAGAMGFLISAGGVLVPTGGFRWLLLGGAAMIGAGANLERAFFPRLALVSLFLAIGLASATYWLGAEWNEGVALMALLASVIIRPNILVSARRLV